MSSSPVTSSTAATPVPRPSRSRCPVCSRPGRCAEATRCCSSASARGSPPPDRSSAVPDQQALNAPTHKEIFMTASYPDLLTGLTEIVDEICGSDTAALVTLDATFDDALQIDSLTMVEVVVACEERFGVKIPDEALEQLKTVGDAVQFIANAGVAA